MIQLSHCLGSFVRQSLEVKDLRGWFQGASKGTLVTENPKALLKASPVVNDFSFVAATANGTGSQTANITLLRALFKMGIPVPRQKHFP
ncbi:MAG: hypothetical protein R2865_05380 [Deinococcales bacterium]